jgi:16S rRNA (guanine527-N7)-methyltransferase
MVSRETTGENAPWLIPVLEQLERFQEILAGPGLERGLMGPREMPRLWDRHILNCAVVADPALPLIPAHALVADVGSGAGLPGLVWAIVRPDLSIVLIEPLLRRATFLTEAVIDLGLSERVTVLRARAEKVVATPTWAGVDIVTARAVAPMERLLGWTMPLLKPVGDLIAFKGLSAQKEIAEVPAHALTQYGITKIEVLTCGAGVVEPTTTVVRARRGIN